MAEDKFSRHVHLEAGGLHGWCVYCSEESRHAALRRAVHEDGTLRVARRLNFLHNVAYRQNPHLARVAHQDEGWVEERRRRRGA